MLDVPKIRDVIVNHPLGFEKLQLAVPRLEKLLLIRSKIWEIAVSCTWFREITVNYAQDLRYYYEFCPEFKKSQFVMSRIEDSCGGSFIKNENEDRVVFWLLYFLF